jgi:hypothetical protein
MDLGERGCGGKDWSCLAQDRKQPRTLVNMVIEDSTQCLQVLERLLDWWLLEY